MTPGDGKNPQQAVGNGQQAPGSKQQATGSGQEAAGCLDRRGRAGRGISGLLGTGVALVLGLRLASAGAPGTERLLVFPFAFFGALGLLQAAAGT